MTMHRHAFLLLLPALLAPPGVAAAELNWGTDYGRALKEAATTGKPVLVVVGTDDCYWCKQLETRTLNLDDVSKMLNERFVLYKLDATRQPDLAKALRVQVYPSLYLANSTGSILGYQEGFVEAEPLKKKLNEVLTAAGAPDAMTRDYELAVKEAAGDQARALKLLRQVVEDGKSRPVQVKARKLIEELEGQAKAAEARARAMADSGKSAEAMAELRKLDRAYPGTPAAREGKQLMAQLVSRAEAQRERTAAAKELLTQARKDYKAKQYLACLDRCETLSAQFADSGESAEADRMAAEIRAVPEVAEQIAGRLGAVYLSLAQGCVKQGKPDQAVLYLERVAALTPGSRHADEAKMLLARLKGAPEER